MPYTSLSLYPFALTIEIERLMLSVRFVSVFVSFLEHTLEIVDISKTSSNVNPFYLNHTI